MRLIGKTAMVTGASRGIGRAIAIELAKEGAVTLVNYKEDLTGIEETLKDIADIGGIGKAYKCDVGNYDQVESMIEEAIKDQGKIDILINNSGISYIGLFSDMKEKEWMNVIRTNLLGTINCSHCVSKYMLSKMEGSIINISSVWGDSPASCEVVYSSTKGAINAFTRSLAAEVGSANIRVNAIAPGVIDTNMNNFSLADTEFIKNAIPLGRYGTVWEVANAVIFLCSDQSSYITGQIIKVNGGFSL